MATKIFYGGPGVQLDSAQQATYDTAIAYLKLSSVLGSYFGCDAVIGGLITAYVQVVHGAGRHQEAIATLEMAIESLRDPEAICIDAAGRA